MQGLSDRRRSRSSFSQAILCCQVLHFPLDAVELPELLALLAELFQQVQSANDSASRSTASLSSCCLPLTSELMTVMSTALDETHPPLVGMRRGRQGQRPRRSIAP